MQNTLQNAVSVEVTSNAPVELSFDQLRHVAGGLGPNDSWASTAVAQGPNDSWAVASGPNDSW